MKPVPTFRRLSDDIVRTLKPPGRVHYGTIAVLLGVIGLGLYAFFYQVKNGLGVAGYQHSVQWGVYITNFVFWIGITHSGTLISAVLFLFRARWRTGSGRVGPRVLLEGWRRGAQGTAIRRAVRLDVRVRLIITIPSMFVPLSYAKPCVDEVTTHARTFFNRMIRRRSARSRLSFNAVDNPS